MDRRRIDWRGAPTRWCFLDSGWSCEKVAGALLLDDDTIRRWHSLFIEDGLEGLTRFEAGGSACQMNGEQQENLKAWVAAALPRSTRQIGAWIEQEFGHVYAAKWILGAIFPRGFLLVNA